MKIWAVREGRYHGRRVGGVACASRLMRKVSADYANIATEGEARLSLGRRCCLDWAMLVVELEVWGDESSAEATLDSRFADLISPLPASRLRSRRELQSSYHSRQRSPRCPRRYSYSRQPKAEYLG